MNITIQLPQTLTDRIITGIMENFPEASQDCALLCTGWNYHNCKFDFEDGETGDQFTVTKESLENALPLLFSDKWPKGCTKPPLSANDDLWNDWLGNSDATDFDAFIQLAIFGEVIYG